MTGDVDGDGLADLMVSGHKNDAEGAESGVVYLFLAADLAADSSLDLSEAHVRLIGEEADDYLGYSLSAAGDVDGDGMVSYLELVRWWLREEKLDGENAE